MKKIIAIPIEILLQIDEQELGGKIKVIKINEKKLDAKAVRKLFNNK